MKSKENLVVLDQFETLIITSPNCFDTIIVGIKNGKLVIRNYYNEHATEDTLNKHTEGLSCIHRDIKFTGKINILAKDGLDKPMLFSIEETANGLKIKPYERKNQNDLNKQEESNNKEFTPLTNLEHQISAIEVAIYNLNRANTPHLNTHTKKMLTSIAKNLITTKNEIRKSVNQLNDEQTYIKKMLQQRTISNTNEESDQNIDDLEIETFAV